MDISQITALVVFALVISLIVSRKLEESLAALVGVALVLILGLVDLYRAFTVYVDWDTVSILFGICIVSFFMRDSGFIDYLVKYVVSRTARLDTILVMVNVIAGVITLFVANVLVVLLLVPVTLTLLEYARVNPAKAAIMVGLSANFMGTALLLGDPPALFLHAVFGLEFSDFVVLNGRPSAFPILLATFLTTMLLSSRVLLRDVRGKIIDRNVVLRAIEEKRIDNAYMSLSVLSFVVVIALMALRRQVSNLVGYDIKLGVFATLVAIATTLYLAVSRKVSFDRVVGEGIDFNAILYYVGLFILVGSLEETGAIDMIAGLVTPIVVLAPHVCYTLIYWVSAPLVAFIEYDGYILMMLKTLRHLYDSNVLVNPWPAVWALMFAGTLGSNYTAAGAPALYVAFKLIEKSTKRKLPVKEIYATTATYTTISLALCYAIALFIWGYS